MKRTAIFFVILGVALAALYYSERRERSSVSPNAMLEVAADIQRDLTRAPMHFTRTSDEEEIKIGNQLAARYSSYQEKFSPEEQALADYVAKVGGSASSHAHRRLPYQFHLVPDRSMVNAFSLPGGHVFVGEGLLDLMDSEDQLAFILGHELEHIDHYHCVERVQVEARFRKLRLGTIGELVQIPLAVWQAGYSKDQELEADREGVRLAVLGGYSPYGAVTLFKKFDELHAEQMIHAKSPTQELSQLAIQSLEGYFRSHPAIPDRIAQIERLISEEHWRDKTTQKAFYVEYAVHNGQPIQQK
ncbi:MAG TPA: M48 family metalloprotease [Terriglobales bacterium]|jgi:predicted Zn-dependent protease|nr:M48 family metalloprotease [Terriglobales bacterium]